MPYFGQKSRDNLASCDERLQKVFNKVIKDIDCSVICGYRGKDEQEKLFLTKKSELKYPSSKHNSSPSRAVDVIPYPVDWDDREQFSYFAGYVLGVAKGMGVVLRWGGDWDGDNRLSNNNFDDLPHFEVIGHI